ncbi:unnamed protein product [Tuber aestivum]|uniref:Uncharacterized protein n=1 Tax=Tuber aestivum TaxID=59557 RepID=A0A292PYW4_9PEZI|nr:unnamed protein product [Tuber aestivum]
MAPVGSTLRQLAVLGGHLAFSSSAPVPLIHTQGYRPKGDFTAVDAILGNEPNDDSKARANDASAHSKVLVPRNYLPQHGISIDEFLEQFSSRQQWSRGQFVFEELRVDAIIGGAVILVPHSAGQSSDTINPVALDESGSSANVTLVPGADGKVTVRKSAIGYGIDGNGAPWLRRQSLFLWASQAVKKTGMFMVPDEVIDNNGDVTLVLPYIPSHSFGELVFANVGAESMVTAMVDMLARMATSVWTEGQEVMQPILHQEGALCSDEEASQHRP